MPQNYFSKARAWVGYSTLFLLLAIILGSVLGTLSPDTGSIAGDFIDPVILVLVTLLLMEVPIKGVFKSLGNIKFISLAWLTNFVVIPGIGLAIASLFLSGQPLFFTGLFIYFMAPCTDWYLGFTRMANGNVELGSALLPINMISQLLLFPLYLSLLSNGIDYSADLTVLLDWFIKPLMFAVALRLIAHWLFKPLLALPRILIPGVLALLVGQIFAANINVLIGHIAVVPVLLLAIFIFFVVTYLFSEQLARLAGFDYPEHCLLSFTTGARNAPLMLGLTTVAIPDQPLIYATITIGMLIEFPHLTALKVILLGRSDGQPMQPASV